VAECIKEVSVNESIQRTMNPTQKETEKCAYFIYVLEGRREGHALDHWLQAELQLAATRMHEAARERGSVSASENSE
jgi:hypothetical protein